MKWLGSIEELTREACLILDTRERHKSVTAFLNPSTTPVISNTIADLELDS